MLLVPKQLQRAGMTGNVPYYGGRFTPAQAYAAAHPSGRPASRAGSHAQRLSALRYLLETGVITTGEYDDLRARVGE